MTLSKDLLWIASLSDEQVTAILVGGVDRADDPLPILPFFKFSHLFGDLREVSSQFARMAVFMIESTKPGPEQTAGLRKLLEAKDCAVRAAL